MGPQRQGQLPWFSGPQDEGSCCPTGGKVDSLPQNQWCKSHRQAPAHCPKQARCLRSRWGRSLHKGRQAGHEQPPLQRGGLLHTGAMSGHQQPSPVWVVPALKELALLPFLICQGRVTSKWAASSRRGRLGLGNTMVALLGKTWGVSDGPL